MYVCVNVNVFYNCLDLYVCVNIYIYKMFIQSLLLDDIIWDHF